MDAWVIWAHRGGVLAVGEIFNVGFFLVPFALARVGALLVGLAGGGRPSRAPSSRR